MSIDEKQLHRQLELLKEQYSLLQQWQSIPKEEFLEEPLKNRAVLHTLQLAIEGCLNIGNQLVSQLKLGKPREYVEIIELLVKNNVLNRSFGEELKRMVRFRNRIVHIYWDVDLEEVYKILQERVGDFEQFERAVLAFVAQLKENDHAQGQDGGLLES